MPSTEENAKTKISTLITQVSPLPSSWATAAWVSEAPSVVSPGRYTSGPANRMMNAVAEHTMIVSTKTPRDCTSPCFTGWLVVAVAAALGALPMPASLENSPRLAPLSRAAASPPVMPAAASPSPNAAETIVPRTAPTWVMLRAMITAASST